MGSERGAVTIIVVWAIAIIGIIVSFMFLRTEAEWASAISFQTGMKFRQAAEAALHERLAFLTTDDTAFDSFQDPWYGGKNGFVQLERDGYKIVVAAEDEGSKPNLNLISEKGLQMITKGKVSINPILDWRDTDSEPREEGAETSYYQSLKTPYKSRNGFFSTTAELKMLKDGEKLYAALAPEVTVFGRINPNTIDSVTFATFLSSIGGFENYWIERAKEEFDVYKRKQPQGFRFKSMDDFESSAFTIERRDRMKPFLRFDGACNVNLVSKTGLEVILKEAGYPDGLAAQLINRRNQQPFQTQAEINMVLTNANRSIRNPQDYLTVVSTIILYRIWVSKGAQQYYLEAVEERFQAGVKKEWQVHPLAWRELKNKEVPEPPGFESEEEAGKSDTNGE